MPPETPEQSARVERRIRLGCLAIPVLAMAFFAGLAVWALITNGHLSTSGVNAGRYGPLGSAAPNASAGQYFRDRKPIPW